MSRIPYPDPARLSPAKREYAANPDRRMLNIAWMAMHAPDPFWKAQLDLATAAVFDSAMDPKHREVLILTVAGISRCEYELFHHRSIARTLGFDDATVEALITGNIDGLPHDQKVVAQFTAEVVRDVAPRDETIAAVRALLSDELIFEMVAIICLYMTTARIIGVGGVEIDEHAVSSWDKEVTTE